VPVLDLFLDWRIGASLRGLAIRHYRDIRDWETDIHRARFEFQSRLLLPQRKSSVLREVRIASSGDA